MNGVLRAELVKVTTTRTTTAVAAGLVTVALIAIVLHAVGLPASSVQNRVDQRAVLVDVAVNLTAAFSALYGTISITGEIRHGTIRPTVLSIPQRPRLLATKAVVVAAAGIAFGAATAAVVIAAGLGCLTARGIDIAVTGSDVARLVTAGAAAGGLWAVVGLGVGAIVRNQVPALVGLLVWILFVENILLASLNGIGRFAPGALARAAAGQDTGLGNGVVAVALLAVIAAVIAAAGVVTFDRHDIT